MEDSVRYPILHTKRQKAMSKIYKRIHMPKPLYEEIERFVSKRDSPYKTVGELCREAGRMLIEYYGLREKYV